MKRQERTLNRTHNLRELLAQSKTFELLKVLDPENLQGNNLLPDAEALCGSIITKLLTSCTQEEAEELKKIRIVFSSYPQNLSSYMVHEGGESLMVINLEMIKRCKTAEELAGIIAIALGYEMVSLDHQETGSEQESLTAEQELKAINFAVSLLLGSGYSTKGLTDLLSNKKTSQQSSSRESEESSNNSQRNSIANASPIVTNLARNIDKRDVAKTIFDKKPISNEDKKLLMKRAVQNTAGVYERNGKSKGGNADNDDIEANFQTLKGNLKGLRSDLTRLEGEYKEAVSTLGLVHQKFEKEKKGLAAKKGLVESKKARVELSKTSENRDPEKEERDAIDLAEDLKSLAEMEEGFRKLEEYHTECVSYRDTKSAELDKQRKKYSAATTTKTALEREIDEGDYSKAESAIDKINILVNLIKENYPPLSLIEANNISVLQNLMSGLLDTLEKVAEGAEREALKENLKELWMLIHYKELKQEEQERLPENFKARWKEHDKYCEELKISSDEKSQWARDIKNPDKFYFLDRSKLVDSPSGKIEGVARQFIICLADGNLEKAIEFAGQILDLKETTELSEVLFDKIIKQASPKTPHQRASFSVNNQIEKFDFSRESSYLKILPQLSTDSPQELIDALKMFGLHRDSRVAEKIGEPDSFEQSRFIRKEDGSFDGLDPDYYPTDVLPVMSVGSEDEIDEKGAHLREISRKEWEIDYIKQQINERGFFYRKGGWLLSSELRKLKAELSTKTKELARLVRSTDFEPQIVSVNKEIEEVKKKIETQKQLPGLNQNPEETRNLRALEAELLDLEAKKKRILQRVKDRRLAEKKLSKAEAKFRIIAPPLQRHDPHEAEIQGLREELNEAEWSFMGRRIQNRFLPFARRRIYSEIRKLKKIDKYGPAASLMGATSSTKFNSFKSLLESREAGKNFNPRIIRQKEKLVEAEISIKKQERLGQETELTGELNRSEWRSLRENPEKFIATYGLFLISSYPAGREDAPFADRFFGEVSKLLKDPTYAEEDEGALKESLKRLLSIRTNTKSETDNQDVLSYTQMASHYEMYSLFPFKADHPAISFLKKGSHGFDLVEDSEKLAFLLRTEGFAKGSDVAIGIALTEEGKKHLRDFLRFPNPEIDSVSELAAEIERAKIDGNPYHQAVIDLLAEELMSVKNKQFTTQDLLHLSNMVSSELRKQREYADSFGNMDLGSKSGMKIPYTDFSVNKKLRDSIKNHMLRYMSDVKKDKSHRLNIDTLIQDYKKFSAYGWLENVTEVKIELLRNIKERISNITDEKERERLLISLLKREKIPYEGSQKTYIYNGVIEDYDVQEWATKEFTKFYLRTLENKDNVDIKESIKDLKESLSPQIFKEVVSIVADKIDADMELANYIRILCESSDSKTFAKDSSEELSLASSLFSRLGIDIKDINNPEYSEILNALQDFLLNPIDDARLNKLVDAIDQKSEQITSGKKFKEAYKMDLSLLPEELKKQLKKEMRSELSSTLKVYHGSFWKMPSEERMGIIDLVSFPEYLEGEYNNMINRIIEHAFDNSKLGEDKNFAVAILKSYISQLPRDEQRLIAVAIKVSTAKQHKGELSTSFGKQLVPLLQHLGPAGTKLAQAIDSYPGTPKDIKKDLKQFKANASPLKRWEVLRLLKKDGITVPGELELTIEGEKKKFPITKIGHVVGSGSFGVTVFLTVADGSEHGKEVAVTLLRENARENVDREFGLMIKAIEETLNNPELSDAQKKTARAILTVVKNAQRASEKEVNMKTAEDQNAEAVKTYHGSKVDTKVRVRGKTYTFTSRVAAFYGRTKNTKTCEVVSGLHFNELPTKTQKDRDFKRAVAKAIIAIQITAIFQGKKIDLDRHGGNFKINGNEIGYFDFGMMQTNDISTEQQNALGTILARIYRSRDPKKGMGDLLNSNVEGFIKEMDTEDTYAQKLFANVVGDKREEAKEYLRDFVKGMLALGDEMDSMKQSVLMGVFARVLNSEDIKGVNAKKGHAAKEPTEVKKAFDAELGRKRSRLGKLKDSVEMRVAKGPLLSHKVKVTTAEQVKEGGRENSSGSVSV